MKSLAWKQWHESKRYVALLMTWMIVAAVYCIAYELGYGFRAAI